MTVLPLELRNTILLGDVRERLASLPDESVHCVVTSPPYWGLRDYGVPGQLGREPSLQEYVADVVDICREVRRVMRPDATFWLNLGDGYVGASKGPGGDDKSTLSPSGVRRQRSIIKPEVPKGSYRRDKRDVGDVHHKTVRGLVYKQLMLQPARIVIALQDDGWIVRCDIIWSKPNPTPESTRDRPTRAHEYLFLLTKAPRYFYDQEAIREPYAQSSVARISQRSFQTQRGGAKDYALHGSRHRSARRALEGLKTASDRGQRRNKRSVWSIAPEATKVEHFASFPQKLVEPCIRAGTSEMGCCPCCGAPWRRQLEIRDPRMSLGKSYHDHEDDFGRGQHGVPSAEMAPYRVTTGWMPSCEHEALPVPCVVFDPFMGSGTTALVASKLGRDYVGIELNPDYIAIAEKRLLPWKGRLL